MTTIFGSDEDGSIAILGEDMPDRDLQEAHESGYWWSIFRISGEDIEYLDIDQMTNDISWIKAKSIGED